MSYITQKKDIEDKYLKLMKGRIFGCDSCQKECPYNKEITYTKFDASVDIAMRLGARSVSMTIIRNAISGFW